MSRISSAQKKQPEIVQISEVDENVSEKIAKAKIALDAMSKLTQEQVDKICEAIVLSAEANGDKLAEMAVEETDIGNVRDKKIKLAFGTRGCYEYMKDKKSVGILSDENGIVSIAEPYGIVAALVPITNPTSTVFFKSMIAVKTRNVVILCFHPKAKKTGVESAKIMLEAAVAAGAPKDCIQWFDEPSLELTGALIKHPEISLVIATGGNAMVKAAYSSGHPAYGVGPGNVPAYIEKSADLNLAVRDVVLSKTFDYGCACTGESTLIFDDKDIAEKALRLLKEKGGYICNEGESARLKDVMYDEEHRCVKGQIVGKSPQRLAKLAGFDVPDSVEFLMVRIKAKGQNDWMNYEKLSPVMGWYIANDKDEAIAMAVEQLNWIGAGHNAVIHSKNEAIVKDYASKVPASKVVWNQPSMHAVTGFTSEMTPSLTVGCGAKGGNSFTEMLTYKHLINTKRLIRRTKSFPE